MAEEASSARGHHEESPLTHIVTSSSALTRVRRYRLSHEHLPPPGISSGFAHGRKMAGGGQEVLGSRMWGPTGSLPYAGGWRDILYLLVVLGQVQKATAPRSASNTCSWLGPGATSVPRCPPALPPPPGHGSRACP